MVEVVNTAFPTSDSVKFKNTWKCFVDLLIYYLYLIVYLILNMSFINFRYKAANANTAWNSLLTAYIRQFSSSENKNHYDIIIAGGGMVGTTLACTLGKNSKLCNKRILLLEASKAKAWSLQDKYSNRVVSLNTGTHSLFNKIGAWTHIENARYSTVKRLQVWDALSDASITFGDEALSENVSYIVENDLLLAAASKEVEKIVNVNVVYGAKVKDYSLPEYHENITQIITEDNVKYTCELLLGCDGVNSQVRKAMKVNYLTWSYDQMGVVATLQFSESIENKIAWQRFLPSGPIAFLPLTDCSSSLVWSTTPEHAKSLLKLPDEEFADAVNKAVWNTYDRSNLIDTTTKAFDSFLRLANCSSDTSRRFPPKVSGIEGGSRAAFPLGFGHSVNYIGKGVALVGDAAHRIHPLAGQGVNLGFGDVTCLNEVLGRAVYAGSRLDNLSYLKEYEGERQKHNIPTMLAVEGLHRLYNSDFAPLVLLRSLGLQATHAIGPLKRVILNQAAV